MFFVESTVLFERNDSAKVPGASRVLAFLYGVSSFSLYLVHTTFNNFNTLSSCDVPRQPHVSDVHSSLCSFLFPDLSVILLTYYHGCQVDYAIDT